MLDDARDSELWQDYWETRSDDARNAIFVHYLDAIMHITRGMCNIYHVEYDDALSCVAETILRRAIPKYDPNVRPYWTGYLAAVIRNTILDMVRCRARLAARLGGFEKIIQEKLAELARS